MRRARILAAAVLALAALGGGAFADPTLVRVTVPADLKAPVSGRLLLFAQPLNGAQIATIQEVDAGFTPHGPAISAQEIRDAAPGSTIAMDADLIAFPAAFSKLSPGAYAVQAVLDVHHHYAYGGREPGDLVSSVTEMQLPAGGTISLAAVLPERGDPWTAPASASADDKARTAAARADTREIDFVSPALSRFWGRPIHMRGWVVTPPGYATHPRETWPTVYFTHGFGGRLRYLVNTAVYVHAAMADGSAPPMIWVLLDESGPTGTHEFADGVNNGPWGEALTTELIPDLEHHWRMDARAGGRFLNGHSSGGWAALWLQTRYPAIFGGAWPPRPIPATSTTSPASTSMRGTPMSIIERTGRPTHWSATTPRSWRRLRSLPARKPSRARLAARWPPSIGCFRRAARTAGRSRCSTASPARSIRPSSPIGGTTTTSPLAWCATGRP
ncbi:MAG TPA: alpha/beta hydrolase-fold protein [Caulobacteraceae bacterium]